MNISRVKNYIGNLAPQDKNRKTQAVETDT